MNLRMIALAGLLAAPCLTSAAPIDAMGILSQFNVVVSYNFSSNSDVEGRTVIGGDLQSGATFFTNPGAAAASDSHALTVYGNSVAGNPLNVNNGGGASIAGTAAGLLNTNGGGGLSVGGVPNPTSPTPLPQFAATFASPLVDLTSDLAALAANSVFPLPSAPGWPNNVSVGATSGAGLAVFAITTSDLMSLASFSIDLNGRSGAIFNVSGTSFTGTANFLNAASIARDVIWNFTDALNLDFQRQWGGTVLAPFATITNSTPIEGTVFGSNFIGSGEVHSQPYRGSLPDPQPPVSVPEPATIGLFSLGLALLIASRRRADTASLGRSSIS